MGTAHAACGPFPSPRCLDRAPSDLPPDFIAPARARLRPRGPRHGLRDGAVSAAPPNESFPLDPRVGLEGPFSESVAAGYAALKEGDPERAAAEFARAAGGGEGAAARIGLIEAKVLGGQIEGALADCAAALEEEGATTPLLVACGEARARGDDAPGAFELYRRAIDAAGRDRPALRRRTEELRHEARGRLLRDAEGAAEAKDWDRARNAIARAVEFDPRDAALLRRSGEIERAAGEREKAMARFREVLELTPGDPGTRQQIAELALEMEDYGLAVATFDDLEREDPSFRPKAEEARLLFRVANWPAPERDWARAPRLTRSAAAQLVWWMMPEVREAKVTKGVIASDVSGRRDSRALTRALSLGLLEVERGTHRASPDAPLTTPAAARLLLRLLTVVGGSDSVECLGDAPASPRSSFESVRRAQDCGLLGEEVRGAITGPEFTRALDRLRSLTAGEPREPQAGGNAEPGGRYPS